ncbi:DcaP family trimeric outer membrane transporter [Pinibacter soli]|uniref:DcaP family trimeric outer membrane transporter n=1 Tax=Pinibacter soli TaxID=3044211 RepID=A0ABT6R6Y9_9BACT|nr:DcaP family trimeric outer membrane transporter [Pinibacter soli]MDI3318326.1 DcaP family trimeric outer membrane transporter [Pinibacter soli]
MNPSHTHSRLLLLFTTLLLICCRLSAQDEKQKSMEIYGAIMTDAGYNFNQIQPDWYDVIRTTKLPSYKNQYGTNGNVYFSVRQTRLGFKNYFPTALGELKTTFEFEMFGTGVDAGQTTLRLRHAYAELGKFGVGQYWSPFMDIDIFPNTLEYWGPVGMPLFRNIQIRYMPIQGDDKLTFALERPGASADQGQYAGRVELQGVNPRFPVPDFSAEYRKAFKWGYVELAGILRYIKWEDQNNDQYNLSGDAVGWGLNLTSNIKAGKNTTFRLGVVYGEGIENYMNDAPVDIGIKNNLSNPVTPVLGKALPVFGVTAFVDHNWNEKFSSSLGYSSEDITNSDAQGPSEFHMGQYAIGNLLWYPAKNVMAGVELQWGRRENNSDGFSSTITKLQFSFKYNFSQAFYRK